MRGSASKVCCVALVLALLGGGAVGAHAQLYRFGKNKVQFDELDWRHMETAHFVIYFYDEEAEIAGYAAHMAEEGYRKIETKSGHTVQRRIPLIVYSSHVYFEQTNVISSFLHEGVAGFTEYLKGRVALPLSGSLPQFERVLHHELVHVFMFDRLRQVLRSRGITDFRPGPLWFSEGLAEYWSGGWDSQGDMVIRDALFSDRLVPVAQMHRINGSFQMYKEGQSICEYMAQRYGTDVFERLLTNWWRAETFDDVFQITTGETLSTLDENWLYQTRKTYLPDIQTADPPSQMAKALTKRGFNLKPAIRSRSGAADEEDSLEVVFFRNDRGHTHIAAMPLTGDAPRVMVAGERSTEYESLHALSNSLGSSHDGRRLAFSAKYNGRDRLYIYDVESRSVWKRLSFPDVAAITSPSWASDDRRIVFAGADRGGISDLYAVDVESEKLTRLTRDFYHDRDPEWHPHTDRIVFSSDRWSGGRRGYYNLFVHDLQDSATVALTRGEHNDLQPTWSPDGTRVAFSSDRDRMYDIFVVPATPDSMRAGVNPRLQKLTNSLTAALDPAWLPNEEGLLFTGFEGARFNLYLLDLSEKTDHGEVAADSAGSNPAYAATSPVLEDGWSLEGAQVSNATSGSRYKSELSLDIAQSRCPRIPSSAPPAGFRSASATFSATTSITSCCRTFRGAMSAFSTGSTWPLADCTWRVSSTSAGACFV